MKKLLFILIALCFMAPVALSAIVKGKVVDSSSQPLQGVTTQIIQYPDSVRKGYMITNAKGEYSFSRIQPGNYVINLSMVGMDDVRKIIEVRDTTTTLNVGTIEEAIENGKKLLEQAAKK